jgi:subtilisin family serine protease
MANPPAINNPENIGSYIWRGGEKIELEKQTDRFTVMPASPNQLERLRSAPGVRDIKPVTNQVFKVETTATENDAVMATVRSEAFDAVAHHSYSPKGSEGTIYYLTDRIVVRFADGASTAQIDELLEKYGLKLLKDYAGQERTYLVEVTSTSGENPIKVANRLAEEELVDYAEPNMVNRFQPAFVPSDSYFRRQWHLDSSEGPQLVAEASVDAPAAWDVTRGERSVVFCLIDDGVATNHPDFQGPGKVVFAKDYVDGDARPFPEKETGDYHGTPCAGVAIAESNGRGVVGIAHGCAFAPVRFPLSADDDLLVEIFEEVGRRADVISCSWGPPPVYAPQATVLYDTFRRLATTGGPRGKGCVICFAAGNYNAPVNDPINSSGFRWRHPRLGMQETRGPILNGEAAHPNVIAVAASTSLNKHAAYSNWGAEISVCAPSNNFHPLDRQRFVPGRGIWTTDNEAFGEGFTARSRYTGEFGGTSSAAPLAAGVAALVLSANPELNAAEVKEVLQNTADKIVDEEPDIVSGVNRGRYDDQGRCDWFGFGKVNAARALAEAQTRTNS